MRATLGFLKCFLVFLNVETFLQLHADSNHDKCILDNIDMSKSWIRISEIISTNDTHIVQAQDVYVLILYKPTNGETHFDKPPPPL